MNWAENIIYWFDNLENYQFAMLFAGLIGILLLLILLIIYNKSKWDD